MEWADWVPIGGLIIAALLFTGLMIAVTITSITIENARAQFCSEHGFRSYNTITYETLRCTTDGMYKDYQTDCHQEWYGYITRCYELREMK